MKKRKKIYRIGRSGGGCFFEESVMIGVIMSLRDTDPTRTEEARQ